MLINGRAFRTPDAGVAANETPSWFPLRRSRALWPPMGGLSLRRKIALAAIAGALLLQSALSGCAGTETELDRDPFLSFVCDGGTSFRVNFFDGHVRVTTSKSAYDLYARPSSIGTKYASNDTTFILDEDRAVLTGADGGPFKRCHEAQVLLSRSRAVAR